MASAEFLKTIYEYGIGENEQDAPIVVMYSDPTFPDRTDSFLAGEDELLLARLTAAFRAIRSTIPMAAGQANRNQAVAGSN